MKKGSKHTTETRAKISAKNKGRKHTAETKAKISEAVRLRWEEPNCRKKMSDRILAAWADPNSGLRKRPSRKGKKRKPFSKEHKAKISAALKGRNLTAETKAKISAALKSRPTPWLDEWRHKPKTVECKKKIANGIRRSMLKTGGFSKGQLRLNNIIKALCVPFEKEHVIGLGNRHILLDVFVPSCNLAIEYDGHTSHRTPEGVIKDRKRDEDVLRVHGIETVRIGRCEVFTDRVVQRLISVLKKRGCKSVISNNPHV